MLVAAVDVGSPKNMGWATNRGTSGCRRPDALLDEIAREIRTGAPVVIGFEAPLWVPRARDYDRMTSNRGGIEARMSRPWSAGAGCGALAAGVANVAWIFSALYDTCGPISCTSQLDRFVRGEAQILVWEAFVSGASKASTHDGDADLAVKAFDLEWPYPVSAIAHEASVNLAVSAVLAAGHTILLDEIGLAGIVIAAVDAFADKPSADALRAPPARSPQQPRVVERRDPLFQRPDNPRRRRAIELRLLPGIRSSRPCSAFKSAGEIASPPQKSRSRSSPR